jgi:hypothetical protein
MAVICELVLMVDQLIAFPFLVAGRAKSDSRLPRCPTVNGGVNPFSPSFSLAFGRKLAVPSGLQNYFNGRRGGEQA